MSCPSLTPERRAALIERYPHEGNPALMAEFGLSKGQLAWFATTLSLKKTAETRSRINHQARHAAKSGLQSLSQQIVARVAQAGEAGMDMPSICSAFAHEEASRVRSLVHVLTKRGLLQRSGERGAGLWLATNRKSKGRAPVRQATTQPVVKVPAISGPAHELGDPCIPAGLEIQYGATVLGPEARLAAQEPGLFSQLGPGRYLADSPTWVNAITSPSRA